MTQKLIIIRGNSGSGKSTIARRLRDELGDRTMLIPQDVIRREILKTADNPSNDAIALIFEMAMYGHKIGYDVIIEGILSEAKYGDMLRKLVDVFKAKSAIYYLDIPFEETLRRHNLRGESQDFGEKELREWWNEKDYLGLKSEVILSGDLSEDELLEAML
jgi:predicted kinase